MCLTMYCLCCTFAVSYVLSTLTLGRVSMVKCDGKNQNKTKSLGTPHDVNLGMYACRWSEALHGVARDGVATSFPQICGVAASYNKTLWHSIGDVTGTEGRGKNNDVGGSMYVLSSMIVSYMLGLTIAKRRPVFASVHMLFDLDN